MEITHFKKEDAHEVAFHFREIFKENGWEEREEDYMDEPHKLLHTDSGGLLLVVKENGKLIGTAGVVSLSPAEGLMKRFYIKKDFRGTGVAQKLLHELLKKAKLMGFSKIVLDVSRSLPRAIRFYEKSGFTKMDTTPRDGWSESFDPGEFFYYYKDIS